MVKATIMTMKVMDVDEKWRTFLYKAPVIPTLHLIPCDKAMKVNCCDTALIITAFKQRPSANNRAHPE